jgi:hypothetical protein
MEGVPLDRSRDNFVCKSGCDETTTLGGVLLLIDIIIRLIALFGHVKGT